MYDNPRHERVAGLLRREIATIVQQELEHEGMGLISITDVEVSRDLGHARIYVSVLDIEHAGEVIRTLNQSAGQVRHQLAQRVRMRSVPELRFLHDTSGETGDRIEQLLAAARKPRS